MRIRNTAFKDDSLIDEFLEELALPHVGVAEVELQLVRHPLVQLLLPLTHLPYYTSLYVIH